MRLHPTRELFLQDWDRNYVCRIPIPPGPYRVRYCARNMDEGKEIDTLVDEDPVDFYKLYFWPAELAPDKVIKQLFRYPQGTHPPMRRSKTA